MMANEQRGKETLFPSGKNDPTGTTAKGCWEILTCEGQQGDALAA